MQCRDQLKSLAGLYLSPVRLCLWWFASVGTALVGPCAMAGPLPPINTGDVTVRLETLASGLGETVDGVAQLFPTDFAPLPDSSGRVAISTLGGIVRMVDGGGNLLATPFLDTTHPNTQVDFSFGMTGIAFHPQYADASADGFGKFYTLTTESYGSQAATFSETVTTGSGPSDNVLIEWTDNNVLDNVLSGSSGLAGNGRELLRIAQPDRAHNTNDLAFDANGLLYIAVGDGGFGVDVPTSQSTIFGDNSPDLTKVFGKILRIDPLEPATSDPQASSNGAYRIPAGQGLPGALPEIYSYGHRNPYRLNFDRETGDLYVGDVGQFQIEEVNQVVQGANYGWPTKEGSFLFDRTNGNAVQADVDDNHNGLGDIAESSGLTDPILEYDHDEGASVTGGFVYRGQAIPQLVGKYVYSDLFGGNGLFYGDLDSGVTERLRFDPSGESMLNQVVSLGEDANGELYLLGSAGSDGRVLRIAAAQLPNSYAADFDRDGKVDVGDLNRWIYSYGENAGADANIDGKSDGDDFLAWQRQFGAGTAQESSAQSIPEPGSALAALMAGLLVAASRLRPSLAAPRDTVKPFSVSPGLPIQ